MVHSQQLGVGSSGGLTKVCGSLSEGDSPTRRPGNVHHLQLMSTTLQSLFFLVCLPELGNPLLVGLESRFHPVSEFVFLSGLATRVLFDGSHAFFNGSVNFSRSFRSLWFRSFVFFLPM